MKKVIIIVIALCIILPFAGFSLDFGGNLDNSTSLSGFALDSSVSLSQIDKLSLWFNTDLSSNISFASSGSYSFSYSLSGNAGEVIPYLLDIDFLNLYGRFPIDVKSKSGMQKPSLFTFTLGRFNAADFSRYVINHRIDGFKLGFNYPRAILSFAVGYTGLITKPTSTILLSKADYTDRSNSNAFFSSPRAVGIADFTFLNLFRQELSVSLIFQQDLRGTLSGSALYPASVIKSGEETLVPSEGGLVDTQYIGLGFKGPLVSSLYYRLFTYLGTGRTLSYISDSTSATEYSYSYIPILSFLGGARLRYFIKSFFNSYGELSFLYTTGDATDSSFVEGNTDTKACAFLPVSASSTGFIFSPKLENIFLFKSGFSAIPIKNIQTLLNAYFFFRSTKGPISEGGIDLNSNSLYLGTEIDGTVNFRPFSDFGLAFTAGAFMPNNSQGGVFDAKERGIEIKGNLEFSFSF